MLLSTPVQDILIPSHHLLTVFLQVANKWGIKKKKIKLLSGERRVTHVH
jgi:hypothetical protein